MERPAPADEDRSEQAEMDADPENQIDTKADEIGDQLPEPGARKRGPPSDEEAGKPVNRMPKVE